MYKFLKLTGRDKWLALQALWMLLFLRIALRIWGYQWVRNRISVQISSQHFDTNDAIHIGSLVNAVIARLGGNCLHRSLVVFWMLRLHGIESSLHFGIPCQPSTKFVAHAWVQIGAIVVNDKATIRDEYAELTQASVILEQASYNFS